MDEEERLVIVRKSNGISALAASLEVSNRLCSIFTRRRASSTSPAGTLSAEGRRTSHLRTDDRSANRRVGKKLTQSACMRNFHRVASPITLASFPHLQLSESLSSDSLFSRNRNSDTDRSETFTWKRHFAIWYCSRLFWTRIQRGATTEPTTIKHYR